MLDKSEYKGKTAVITGAASGMGLFASRELVAAGANVVMCDLNEAALRSEVEKLNGGTVENCGGRAIACVTDVRKFTDAEKAAAEAAKLGGCDILITFAGGNEARCCKSHVPFFEQPVEVLDWGIDVNLKGPIYFARALMPQMVATARFSASSPSRSRTRRGSITSVSAFFRLRCSGRIPSACRSRDSRATASTGRS